ncbi:sensor histidine kinase [Shimazuella kribbensis]|uniref:sensor histidine kinase n=1 Tax=Shimazuella kribbensis TaxID=139808 RepID=UPI0004248F6B|nr:sensor histidine kinase [Shimazuella kribbensis]
MRKSILFYLRTKLPLIGLVYVTGTTLYVLFAIGFYYSGYKTVFDWSLFAYGCLLITSILLGFLLWQGFRYVPHYQKLDQLLIDKQLGMETPKNSPMEFQRFWDVYQHMYKTVKAEHVELEQIHQRHLQFIHIWIHQMKTSVATLSLLSQQYDNEQKTTLLEEVEKIDDGLDLALTMARLDHFVSDYQVKRLYIADIIREVINEKRRLFIRSHIFPKIEEQTQNLEVITDPKWLKFILEQLIQNAVKYTIQIKEEAYLRFSITEEENTILLSITDEGPGIPKQDLPRIFDAFFTGENGRRFAEATGMGLYVVRVILENLHHSYEVESKVGSGTTFHIRFQKVTKM